MQREPNHAGFAMRVPGPRTIEAYNLSRASENKIHDDTVAKRFGFAGGLVPGVEVFAYAAHAPVAAFGPAFLARGFMSLRFQSPVYDGRPATMTARADGDRLALTVECDGKACASGHADMTTVTEPIADIAFRAPPRAAADRPPADEASLADGTLLSAKPTRLEAAAAQDYLRDIRESEPLYAREGVLHPGWLLRRCNAVLVDNVVLPPWIHVGSDASFRARGRVGETIEARARVTANYERKGHRLVDLDVAVSGEDGRRIADVRHTAIYRLRGN
jgi:acyl dehydratase